MDVKGGRASGTWSCHFGVALDQGCQTFDGALLSRDVSQFLPFAKVRLGVANAWHTWPVGCKFDTAVLDASPPQTWVSPVLVQHLNHYINCATEYTVAYWKASLSKWVRPCLLCLPLQLSAVVVELATFTHFHYYVFPFNHERDRISQMTLCRKQDEITLLCGSVGLTVGGSRGKWNQFKIDKSIHYFQKQLPEYSCFSCYSCFQLLIQKDLQIWHSSDSCYI